MGMIALRGPGRGGGRANGARAAGSGRLKSLGPRLRGDDVLARARRVRKPHPPPWIGDARIAKRSAIRSLLRAVSYGFQGMFRISCGIGIMFTFKWCMTHSEPARVITTITMVKIRASMFQPPSDFVFMCRK